MVPHLEEHLAFWHSIDAETPSHNLSRRAHEAWMSGGSTRHAHGASLRMEEFYDTQEVIDMVSQLLREDVELLGYRKMVLGRA
jgi:hypothetical protein